MKAIKTDKYKDPILEGGGFVFVYDIDVIKQNCECVMSQYKTELIYNQDVGIDYFGNLFKGVPNLNKFEIEARDNLILVDGVEDIIKFNKSINNNTLSYSVIIRTMFGDHEVNGDIQI